jgi:hypothetical protein
VAGEGEWRETGLANCYFQFLSQFPYECLLGPLTVLDLATWKFPQPGHRLALGPLCDEHAAVGVDKRAGGDEDDLDSHGP